MPSTVSNRIEALRSLMRERGWDAVIVTGSDPHSSEYPASRWQQVEWLSGFTGEAGDLVITASHAGLWTDSRYFIQAVAELEGSGIVLHKTRQADSVTIPQWISENLSDEAAVVAYDGLCLSSLFVEELQNTNVSNPAFRLADCPDLLSLLWEERPSVPQTPVTTLSEENVGKSRYDKLKDLRKWLLMEGCDAILLTSLDEIAWLLNVRGSDIEYNPYVVSYLLVTQEDALWFAAKEGEPSDPDTLDSFAEIEADGVTVLPYSDIDKSLVGLSTDDVSVIFADPSTLNAHLYATMTEIFSEENIRKGQSPVILTKAVKNEVEQEWLRTAFLEDGVAMEKFLYWLDKEVSSGQKITEWDASVKLSSLRAEIQGYRGNSFCNISAYGPSAALPHYSTPEYGSAEIRPEGLYLVDSGGQYIFGTTDITRTVPMGRCSSLEKEDYTLVLKGMIDLSMAVFPRGTAGCQLDVLARNPLWQSVRNFGHGTGHGVGFYLGVHEGPQDIRQNFNTQPLLPGMVTSDEPGIYREGSHGVRHENILLCREHSSNEFGSWLCFETLTVCHIDTSAIIRELMTADEIAWLNEYNAFVYKQMTGRLDAETLAWLRVKTLPL